MAALPADSITVRPRRRFGYQPALDGLRAVAVAGVVAYHAGVGAVPGGFLGVDAFFVLSGFLITGLLVAEWTGSGRLRLGAFWLRRARRLLPALLVMVCFVLAVGAVGGWAEPGDRLRGDVLAVLFYVANWHFVAAGGNYFTATGPVSPLTHTWTLGVEEQFYLLWPLVVLGVVAATRRRLGPLLAVCLAGAAASAAAMAVWYRPLGNTTRLYYGTDTHAQALLAGAALAVVFARRPAGTGPARRRWSRAGLGALGVAGAAGLGWAWTHATGTAPWLYRGGFLVDALAVCAVVASVVGAPGGPVARLLSLAPLRALGRISYGVYLWHFPLFVFLDAARTGLHGPALLGARLGATLAAATASYHLVEQPVRRRRFWRPVRVAAAAPVAVGAVVAAAFLAVPVTAASADLAARPAAPVAATEPGAPRAALRILLVGDSMAETLGNGWTPAVTARYGVTVTDDGDPNCSLATGAFRVQDYPPRASAPPCQPGSGDPGWPADWAAAVAAVHPDVSVFLARLDVMDRYFDGRWTHVGDPAYDAYLEDQMRTAVRVLSSGGGQVVFLTSPYYDTGEQPDGAPWPEDDPARVDLYNTMLRQVAAEFPGVASVVDLNAIADPGGRFAPDVDGVPLRYLDGVHWTYQGDAWLAGKLLPTLAAVGRRAHPA